MKQDYEAVVIYDGILPDEIIQKEHAKLEDFIKLNGEYERVDIWGKRTLAYTINKKKSGVYYVYYFKAASEINIANKITLFFKLNDNVIRHLTVVHEIQKVYPPRVIPATSGALSEEGIDDYDE